VHPSQEEWLVEQWSDLAGELVWADGPSSRAVDDLVDRYRQPHRHYHGIAHLAQVLQSAAQLCAPSAPPAAVRLALWFHDAVYAGKPGDDEEQSALLAERVLSDLGTDEALVTRVAAGVRATAGHLQPVHNESNTDIALVLDADLSILGADPGDYDTYTAGVRAEYAHVADGAFRTGRLAVVETLLARPGLFVTAAARSRWEERARQNLRREREVLTAPHPDA
jgi:predicted metal-dependent HD superfamily phosphohydrolase